MTFLFSFLAYVLSFFSIRDDAPKLLENTVVLDLAKKYGKTPGQILLRHTIQRNIVAIPKSANPLRIRENINVFDFALDPADMKRLDKQNKDLRLVENKSWELGKFYPFHDEY